jgi:SSS family solute:Na+ symporter
VTRAGAIAGIVVGVGVVAAMTFTGATPGSSTTLDSLIGGLPGFLAQLNLGVVALVINLAVTAAVSMATRRGDAGAPARDEAPRFSREPAMERARQA